MLAFGLFSVAILLLTTKDMNWLMDEVFAIMISILFFSPVVNALIQGKAPKEWIVVFVIGGFLFVISSILYYTSTVEIIELFFTIIVVTVISTIGNWIANKLMAIVPPK